MSSLKFGTSGLRGLITDMRPDICGRYIRAFLRHLEAVGAGSRDQPVLVGRDLRESSPPIAAACLLAAQQAGYAVIDCGALPTPALALEAQRRGAPAIMVTGSHIPADRNGLKFFRPDGEIAKTDEAGILARFELRDDDPAVMGAERPVIDASAFDNYRRRYASSRVFALEGMRIGIYQHSSVARDLIAEVLASLGAEPVPLCRSNVFVPVDTEALRAEDVEIAQIWAGKEHFDAIVSTDGDADRPLVACEKGCFLRGDVIGMLTASFLGAATVVTPVTSSSAVEKSGLFRNVVRTKVGSPYVIEAMAAQALKDAGVTVGFEANGGVLLGSPVVWEGFELKALPTRDALLPILSVLALARRQGKTVAELGCMLPARFTASGRLADMANAQSTSFLALFSDIREIEVFLGGDKKLERIDRTDGARLMLTGGDVLHFRASGNAPELRCYAESSTPGQAARLLEWGLCKAASACRKGMDDELDWKEQ